MGHVFDARAFSRWYITPGCGGETFGHLVPECQQWRMPVSDKKRLLRSTGPGVG